MSDVSDGHVTAEYIIEEEKSISLFKPWGESLPNNQPFNSWLASLSLQLINRHLVTMVIKSFTNGHFSTKNKQGLNSGECMHTVYWYNNSNSDQFYKTVSSDDSVEEPQHSTTSLCTFNQPIAWIKARPITYTIFSDIK